LTLGIPPVGLEAALTPERLYQKVLPSVMSLEVENQTGERYVGSAVLALADDVVLTTWHVVADARSVWAVFADGQRVKVIGCIDHDSRRDVALLKLEKGLPHRQAALCRKMQSIASRAYVIGAPKGYDFSISDGLISQIRSVDGFSQYQVSCPISPGNSGSPVFNQRGEVIGVAAWTKADAQNVNFAIPAREFSQLVASKPPATWDQLGAIAQPPSTSTLVKARQPALQAVVDGVPAGGYSAFSKRLNEAAGKPVTIIVQEEGKTNIYSFTIK
jgi:S1-C subfamily serine protease